MNRNKVNLFIKAKGNFSSFFQALKLQVRRYSQEILWQSPYFALHKSQYYVS